MTVGSPTAPAAPQTHVSVVRTAGRPCIITVLLPEGNTLTIGWCTLGGKEQMCMSPTTAAGRPLIMTVETPGPVMVPP